MLTLVVKPMLAHCCYSHIVISDFCNDSHSDSVFYSLFKSYGLCEFGLFLIIICVISAPMTSDSVVDFWLDLL